jgi:hypothetical protein
MSGFDQSLSQLDIGVNPSLNWAISLADCFLNFDSRPFQSAGQWDNMIGHESRAARRF